MANSIRQQITDAFVAALEGITVANGYNCDVEKVLRKMPNSEELPSSDPYLVIVDLAPDSPRQYCDGNKIRADMTVAIVPFIRGATSDAPPTDEISAIISDLRELIHSPISLGSQVRFVEETSVSDIFTGDTKGWVHYDMIIDYWYDADSP